MRVWSFVYSNEFVLMCLYVHAPPHFLVTDSYSNLDEDFLFLLNASKICVLDNHVTKSPRT